MARALCVAAGLLRGPAAAAGASTPSVSPSASLRAEHRRSGSRWHGEETVAVRASALWPINALSAVSSMVAGSHTQSFRRARAAICALCSAVQARAFAKLTVNRLPRTSGAASSLAVNLAWGGVGRARGKASGVGCVILGCIGVGWQCERLGSGQTGKVLRGRKTPAGTSEGRVGERGCGWQEQRGRV